MVFILLFAAFGNFFYLFLSFLVCLTVFYEIFFLISPRGIKHKLFSIVILRIIFFVEPYRSYYLSFFLLTSFILLIGILWYHQFHHFYQIGHHQRYRESWFLAKSHLQTCLYMRSSIVIYTVKPHNKISQTQQF